MAFNEFPQGRFCVTCGRQAKPGDRFCEACGAALDPLGYNGPQYAPAVPSQGGAGFGQRPHIPNYLVWAILATICCCVPTGIIAIVYSAQVNGKVAAGDYATAQNYSNEAPKVVLDFRGHGDSRYPDMGPDSGDDIAHNLGRLMMVVERGQGIGLSVQAGVPLSRWRFVFLGLALLPCLALVYARNPEEPGYYPPCLFYALTGLYCPGCGTLRGLHQLLHGNLIGAFGYNPFTMLALPIIGYAFLSALADDIWGKRLPTVFVHHALIWGLLVAVVSFWALRNVPVYPLTVLAP